MQLNINEIREPEEPIEDPFLDYIEKIGANPIAQFVFWIAAKLIIIQFFMHSVTTYQVDKQLGFSYATPYENDREVFIITESIPGMVMYEAGLREGDYVLFHSVDKLYYLLVFNQGKKVCIPVQREEQQRYICLRVPLLKLIFPPKLVYWLV